MKQQSVAILDIRSGGVTFAIGRKGVNGICVLDDFRSENYEGFFVEKILDVDSFRRAMLVSINAVCQNYGGVIDEVYVGVPSAFISVQTTGHTLCFVKNHKISAQDVERLYESGQSDLLVNGRCIHRSAMYFSLGDNRKYFTPEALYGTSSTILKGALCYYLVDEQFYSIVSEVLTGQNISKVHFVPSTLAQASYMIPEKEREGYSFLLDIGFLTTSISIIYGNGIVHEQSINCGIGTIYVALMQELGIEYSLAEEILSDANISGGVPKKDLMWTSEALNLQFPVQRINDIIKYNLDFICESIEQFFARYYKDKASTALTANAISVTGEGAQAIKGVAEHVSRRLNRLTQIVYPDQPYFDKPVYSSRISLLGVATKEEKKNGILQVLFGGKRK